MSKLSSYLLLLILPFFVSCSLSQNQLPKQIESDNSDLSCSYFYFLWGSHAEYNDHYEEAEEAYQKALICDPSTDYVRRKIPVLMLKMGNPEKAISWLEESIKQNPDDISLFLFLANLHLQQENTEEAIKLYDKVIELQPDDEDVRLRLAFLYTQQEQYTVAKEILRSLLKNNEEYYFAQFYLARLLRKTKNFKEAALEYEKALTLNWSKELAFEMGRFYAIQTRHDDALRIFTSITDNDPYDERASLSRILALLDLKRNEEALSELSRLRESSPNKDGIDLITAKIYIRDKSPEKAKPLLLQLEQTSDDSEPSYLLALLFFQENDFGSALYHLEAVAIESEVFEDSVFLQNRIFKKMGSPDLAIELLNKHISEPTSRSPLFYALLSSLYQEKENTHKALETLKAAIEFYSENPQLHFEYGLLLERNGDYKSAIIAMETVIHLQADHAEALNFIGYTLADNNTQLDRAFEYIKKAVELKPDNGYIIDSLGWVYFRLGKFEKAAKELLKALELEPNDPHIYDHLGDVYHSQKKFRNALEAYRQAYEMFKDEKKRIQVKEKIDKINAKK